MIDSSVWIDYFRGVPSPQTDRLDAALGQEALCVGDIVLTEVLQGFDSDRDFQTASRLLSRFETIAVVDKDIAIGAARNFRLLRSRGITVRKTIDTIIATRCIESGLSLLHSDRDFDPFVAHLGLKVIDASN